MSVVIQEGIGALEDRDQAKLARQQALDGVLDLDVGEDGAVPLPEQAGGLLGDALQEFPHVTVQQAPGRPGQSEVLMAPQEKPGEAAGEAVFMALVAAAAVVAVAASRCLLPWRVRGWLLGLLRSRVTMGLSHLLVAAGGAAVWLIYSGRLPDPAVSAPDRMTGLLPPASPSTHLLGSRVIGQLFRPETEQPITGSAAEQLLALDGKAHEDGSADQST